MIDHRSLLRAKITKVALALVVFAPAPVINEFSGPDPGSFSDSYKSSTSFLSSPFELLLKPEIDVFLAYALSGDKWTRLRWTSKSTRTATPARRARSGIAGMIGGKDHFEWLAASQRRQWGARIQYFVKSFAWRCWNGIRLKIRYQTSLKSWFRQLFYFQRCLMDDNDDKSSIISFNKSTYERRSACRRA